ncbi:MAG TPA: hypothetical protein DCR93_22075 [Cytophagales bacterium]|nr:hypothetical protein [Cytophagales bacterium]HAP62067.1 hypothetical protein [Cytophagales bacterium]
MAILLCFACSPTAPREPEGDAVPTASRVLQIDSGYAIQYSREPSHPAQVTESQDTLPTGKVLPVSMKALVEDISPRRLQVRRELLGPDPFYAEPMVQAPEYLYVPEDSWSAMPAARVFGDQRLTINAVEPDTSYPFRVPAPVEMREGGVVTNTALNMIRLGLREGMPSDLVSACFVDQQGDVWVASNEIPIFRYDGHRHFPIGEKEGFPLKSVTGISQDLSGHLWFVSAKEGVVRFDGFHFHHYFNPYPLTSYARDVLVDDEGAVWIALSDGLLQYTQGAFHFYSLGGASCLKLFKDQDGSLLVSTLNRGIIRYAAGNFFCLPEDVMPRFNVVSGFWRQPGGPLWMSQYGKGVVKWQQDSACFFTMATGLPSNKNGFLVGDTRGTVWVGNDDVGLYGIDAETDGIIKPQGLESFSFRFYSEDPKGNLWLGSLGYGIFQFSPQVYEFLEQFGSEALKATWDMVETDPGTLWLVTDGDGILRWKEDEIVQYTFPENPGWDHLTTIAEDARGHLWMGLTQGGLVQFDGQDFWYYALTGMQATDLLWDGQDRLWIRSKDNRLLVWEDGVLSQVMVDHVSPAFLWLGNLALGEGRGEIWVPHNLGLLHIDGQTATYLSAREGLFAPDAYTIAKGAEGTYWYSSQQGISSIKDGVVSYIPYAQTNTSRIPFSMTVDQNYRVWIGSNQGLASALVTDSTARTIHLPTDHPLQQSTKDVLIRKLLSTSDGAIWGSSLSVLFRFYPSQENLHSSPPKPQLAFVQVNEQTLLPAGGEERADKRVRFDSVQAYSGIPYGVSLPPQENHLTFGFRAGNGESPLKLRYRYRMAGLETDWSQPSPGARAEYRSLPSGNHTLEVQASLVNGQWSSTTQYAFVIRSPWYQTPWAYIGYIVLFLGLVWLGFRWRVSAYRRQADQKARLAQSELTALKAQMNPHFIFNALGSIQKYILKNDPEQANEYLNKYSRLMRQILDQSGRSLITLSEEVQTIQNYIDLEQLRLSHKFSYQIQVSPMLKPERVRIPSMVIQPYIENAIWHGLSPLERAGQLLVSFVPQDDTLVISVEDNGVGRAMAAMAKTRKDASKGSKITQDRLDRLSQTTYQNMKTSLVIEDLKHAEGHARGTRVVIRVPLDIIA